MKQIILGLVVLFWVAVFWAMYGCSYRIYVVEGDNNEIILDELAVEKKGGQYEFSPTVDIAP